MFNPYNINPYMNQYMPQRQQMMQTQSSLLGEMVTDYEMVKTARVDMSGQRAYYPAMDGSVIYTKALMPDGTAKISTYRLAVNEEQNNAQIDNQSLSAVLQAMNNKIDSIQNTMNELWGNNDESISND